MALLTSKWTIALLVILLVLIILYVVGKKSAHTEIIIQAPPQKVWTSLTDISLVKEWNEILIPVEGVLKEGNKITYEFYQEPSNKAVMSATVVKMVPDKLINQKGGIPGVLTFNHKYMLEPYEGGTKVTIHEEYRGIMVPFWNPAPVEAAYSRLLEALKSEVESKK